MRTLCAWCGVLISVTYPVTVTSHGICPSCAVLVLVIDDPIVPSVRRAH